MRHHTSRDSRPSRLVIGLLAGALALTACAQGGRADGTDGSGGSTGAATGADEPVTIRWSWWGSDTRHTLTQEVIELFEQKNPTITVVPDYTDWDSYFDKLAVAVAGGDAPDVITQEESNLADYASRGVLADLSQLEVDTSKIADDVLESGALDGALYGVATGINVYAIVADPQAFADAGVEMPDDTTWTWDDYIEIADEISARSGGAVFGAQDYGFNEPGFGILARQHGQSLYDEDGGLGFDSELLAEWWQRSLDLQAGGGQPDAATTVEVEAGGPEQSLIGTNRGAMAWFWSNQLTALTAAAGRPLELLRVPGESQFERTGMYVKPAMLYSVSSTSEHPEAAAKLVDFLVNDPDAGAILLSDRGLPANTDVRDAVADRFAETDRHAAEFLTALEDEIVDGPVVPPVGAGQVSDITRRLNAEVLFGRLTPQQAADQFVAEVTAAIS